MKSKEKKPMSLKRKILSAVLKALLVLLGLVIVAVTVFAILFWDTFVNIVKNPELIPYVIENWDTLSRGLSVSPEDIEADEMANAEAQAKAFAEANINLTVEDISTLSDGSLTEQERAEIIYQAMTSGNGADAVTDVNGDGKDVSEQPENNGADSASQNGTDENPPEMSETASDVNKNTADGEDNAAESENNESVKNDNAKPDDTKPADNKPTPENKPAADNGTAKDTKPDASQANGVTNQGTSVTGTTVNYVDLPNVTVPVTAESGNGYNYGGMTEEQYNVRVSELVARMYSIKADFVSKLSAFENQIISQYKALPKEQRTSATKSRIVSDNMNYIMGLEAQCDAQVKAVTDELTALMTANGKSTALVDQINAAYVNEKEIKKAYYVSLYK